MKKPLNIEENARKFKSYLRENHLGKDNAIKARDLTQFGNPRSIRFLVNELRKQGVPVCSGVAGYWYASKASEIDEITNQLRQHISDLREVCKGLDNAQYNMAFGMESV
jgi:hypothetical protein